MRFADRINGMSQESVVYEGAPAGLTDEQLKTIYGGQDRLHG
jgi:ABC-type phosphate/phosphonate transport system ATPase subunit